MRLQDKQKQRSETVCRSKTQKCQSLASQTSFNVQKRKRIVYKYNSERRKTN